MAHTCEHTNTPLTSVYLNKQKQEGTVGTEGESVSGLVDFLYPKREPQMHRQFLPTVSAQDQGVSTAGFSEALSLNLNSIFLYSDTHHLGEGSPL